jgi:DNA-binding MarR family transcriptional regulator
MTRSSAPPHTGAIDGQSASLQEDRSHIRSSRSQRSKNSVVPGARHHLPATVSLPALLDRGFDRQFRRLVQDLLTVARRLETARDYFGQQIGVTGPQYHLLMTVAHLQSATVVSVGSVAQVMNVSSAFVTSETGKLSAMGLVRKRPNPLDRRGALLSLTQAGRVKIERLIPAIRAVNDLFFGRLDSRSFTELCAGAAALVQGSREAIHYIERAGEERI